MKMSELEKMLENAYNNNQTLKVKGLYNDKWNSIKIFEVEIYSEKNNLTI